jgi:hypothetical protein
VHRRQAGVQERLQFGRERAFVRQDPRAGLHHVKVARLRPGGQDRVRRQPRVIAEEVVADVVHRRQAVRDPVGVERRAEHRVIALGVKVPQDLVVGHVRWKWSAGQRGRRVVWRRQVDRAVAHILGVDAQLLGHRPRADRGRYHAAGHQRIASLGCRGDLVEPGGDQLGREPGHVVRRRRRRRVH